MYRLLLATRIQFQLSFLKNITAVVLYTTLVAAVFLFLSLSENIHMCDV